MLSTAWTAGLDEERKQRLLPILQNNTILFTRIIEILSGCKDNIEIREISEDHFSKPDWATREAFLLGRKRQLDELLTLFCNTQG